MCNDWKRRTFMAVTLNQRAYEHAKELIDEGRFVFDERDAWSEHQPSAMKESEYIRLHGFAEYGKWYLGVNGEKPDNTKGHYEFPLWRFQGCPPLWCTRCGKPCRPIPALRHRECGSAPAWIVGGSQGRIGPEALVGNFRWQIGARSRHPVRCR
jgi:hypothetical protein